MWANTLTMYIMCVPTLYASFQDDVFDILKHAWSFELEVLDFPF